MESQPQQLPLENENPVSVLPQTSQDPAYRPSIFTSSLPRSLLSCKSRTSTRTSLHGLGTLGKIQKDLSSFLRTGSLSRHNGEVFLEATTKLGHSGYADVPEPSSRRQSADLRNMFSTTSGAADERPARKLKKENKFYNFLTRSRSRSQSQTDLSPPENPDSVHEVPQNDHRAQEHSGSKPPHRIPSRPISSTTTGTNTTITPGTPKAKKQPPSSIPIPSSSKRRETSEVDVRRPRPTIPTQPTNTRRKINIFGISITRPRSSKSRSRSRSRPGTPRMSVDIPPLPTFGFEEELRGLQSSQPSSRAASPAPPSAKGDLATTLSLSSLAGHDPPNPSKEASSDSHASSSKLRGFFAGKDSGRSRHQNSSGVPPNLVSAPVKRVPSIKRNSLNKALPERPQSPPADPRSSSPPINSSLESNMPRITTTPASPIRAATMSAGTTKSASSSTSRARFGFRNKSLDTGYRYQGTMDVVNEEGRLSRESKDMKGTVLPRPGGSKGKEKESTESPAPRTSISRMSTSVRSTKHGSFDFERPGLGAIPLQRSASGGTSTTVTSGWSRSVETSTVRESALGPGLAGVGTVQRNTSVKRGEEREEKAKEIKKQAKEAAVKKVVVVKDPEFAPPKTNPSPAHSSNGHQTPPSGTASGKSSSLSKASGKRFFGRSPSGSRKSTQHGLFSFESPVPSPTWSATSTSTTKEVSASWGGRTEKEKERPVRKEREKETKDRAIERKHSQKRDRSPVPVPKIPTFVAGVRSGVRSGGRGRSLDLNLGLAWAPSKVREDALLKTSSLFNRSVSNSSGSGSRSANSSAHGHDMTGLRLGDMVSEERLKLGREIGEVFRKVLGEARYMRFKTYIYQFDAHEIPFDGPTGVISKVDGLLATVPTLGLDERRRLMDKFVRIILQNA